MNNLLYTTLLLYPAFFIVFSGASSRLCTNESGECYAPIPIPESSWIVPNVVEGIDEYKNLPRDDDNDDESAVNVVSSSNMTSVVSKCTTSLPSMASSGGLIFFLHIPKTGGTTIRLNLNKLDDRVQYIFARNYSSYQDTAPIVEDIILHGTKDNTIVVYEVHASTSPSFYRIRNRLQRWKETARRNNVPAFFFTVLRESVPFAVSHFSFFHLQKRNPTFERCNATEENFLRLSLYNPQCQFLFKGEPSLRAQKPTQTVITFEECYRVQNRMLQIFDWIGSTETLSTETIPLLSRLVGISNNFTWENHRISSDVRDVEYFWLENVSSSALEIINDISTMDIELYRIVTNRYRYEEMIPFECN
jgi:hypothetical protein